MILGYYVGSTLRQSNVRRTIKLITLKTINQHPGVTTKRVINKGSRWRKRKP